MMDIIFEKEIQASTIIISPRPVWKCRSCPNYGKTLSCPPHAPSWHEAKEWVSCFSRSLLIKFAIGRESFKDDKLAALHYLLDKEKELFASGKLYASALFPGSCTLCSKCSFAKKGTCAHPTMVRPSVDALGIELTSITELDFRESVLYGLVMID